jgi:2,3-bisphosphoglycerate-independent phosphoglycerate mutase
LKFIVLLGDGMADYSIPELNNKTPLQEAKTPNMDFIAKNGVTGSVNPIPDGYEPGSDVANLSILGYDPEKYYTGRAPLEAASIGVDLFPEDIAFRCNLVTLGLKGLDFVMEDHSAGHISTEDASLLISNIGKELNTKDIIFHHGVSYRHLMVWKNGRDSLDLTPPHDILGQKIVDFLPKGEGSKELIRLMNDSQIILNNHEINKKREEKGLNPANSIWLWGQGKVPHLVSFEEKYHVSGAIISAVDLIKGMGLYAGLKVIDVPGATGYFDTNYEGKAQYAIEALKERDFVYLHVEAPDEAGHAGNVEMKVKAIEDFDSRVVGRIVKDMKQFGDYKILLLPDHATPISLRTHTGGAVPFAILSNSSVPDQGEEYNERLIEKGSLKFAKGHQLMDYFITEKLQ